MERNLLYDNFRYSIVESEMYQWLGNDTFSARDYYRDNPRMRPEEPDIPWANDEIMNPLPPK